MSEPEATQPGEPLSDAPTAQAFDPSVIRGLQAPPAADFAQAGLDDASRREALASELATRAARLAEAVDDALVLANDGAIRWLGDPVAKLAAGETPLAPRAVLLADEALPAASRELAERRVSLWLAEHMRKVLGPLIGLADALSIPEPAREIALKVSQALGVLERERVKAQVKALDQDARGALRKLGVRFGAHYIFVPALLKPAARTLCAHLWALPRHDGDSAGAAEKLLHFAASGRTSFAVEPPASGDLYRVAGFRLCGERAVRVDIVERLTDLIRAALPRTPGSHDEADGFIVTNQMTSLTGCSGEHFASILRSLGFVSHQVKKSAFLAAAALRAASSAPLPQVALPTGAPDAATEAAAAGEAAPDAAAAREPTAEGLAPADAAEAPIAAAPEEPVAEPVEFEAASEAEIDGAIVAAIAEPVETEPVPIAETEIPVAAPPEEPPVETVPAEPPRAVAAEALTTGDDEMVEVWRPAPRRSRPPPHRHRGPPREAGAPREAAASSETPPRAEEGAGRRPWRERKGPAAAPVQAGETAKPERSGDMRRGRPPWRREGGKGPGEKREDRHGAPKSGGETSRPAGGESRQPSVNLDSPFAKLLDLKPLLQARDKGR